MSGTEKIIGEILDINVTRDQRKKYIFRNSPIDVVTDEGDVLSFPCIALYEIKSGLPVGYPRFERWYLPIEESIQKESESLRKRAANITVFLNFILHHTSCNSLDELEQKHIRRFLVHFRETKDGKSRNVTEWKRGIRDIFLFLFRYAEYNKSGDHLFAYDLRDLIKITVVEAKDMKRKLIVYEPKLFGVKSPDEKPKKHRYLMEGYLTIILMAARKHDPMLALGIALQAFAGLREGEIVNLTRRGSIKILYGGFGRCTGIEVDLQNNAEFFQMSGQGHIKKKRTQFVYPDFVAETVKYLNEHDQLLRELGCEDVSKSPLFVNKWGRPMTVTTYSQRVKSLFYGYVIPAIHRLADRDGTWYLHEPFLEIWEDRVDPETGEIRKGEYPGAHMLRHWFTMYLVSRGLSIGEIAKFRGDKDESSMMAYVHVHAETIDLYKKISKSFQESIIQEII